MDATSKIRMSWWAKLVLAVGLPFYSELIVYYGGGLFFNRISTDLFVLVVWLTCLTAIYQTIRLLQLPREFKLLRTVSSCLLVLFLIAFLVAKGSTSSCGPEFRELAAYGQRPPSDSVASAIGSEESCS